MLLSDVLWRFCVLFAELPQATAEVHLFQVRGMRIIYAQFDVLPFCHFSF